MNSKLFALIIHRQLMQREVPTSQLDGSRCARPPAQRENAGHEGHLAQGDAVHEVLTPAVDGVLDFQDVIAVLGDLVVDDRVGVEAEVVGIGQLVAPGVQELEGGLEPARDGVGQVGNQPPRADGGDQARALGGLEAEAVHVAGHDLSVHDDGEGLRDGQPHAGIGALQDPGVGLVVVGPEAPLVAGMVDDLSDAGIRAFGPTAAAAQLEGSKAFMKDICSRYGIPTAAYGVFTDAMAAKSFVRTEGAPIVATATDSGTRRAAAIAAAPPRL